MRLAVKVVPGAARDEIAGWLGEELKIRIRAQPEKGKANKAVMDILARALNIPRQSIRLVSGTTSPHKILEINCSESELDAVAPR